MEYNYSYQPDDPYCYPGTKTLMNKMGITDSEQLQHAERRITALRLASLPENPVRGSFDFAHLRAIHRFIFGDIYDWAGKIRLGEFLTKGNTIFCLGRHIDSYANSIFSSLSEAKNLRGLAKNAFIDQLAYFMGEVNALHPFREGNGRTIREFFRLLSKSAGYDLDFGSADRDALLSADIEAFDRNYKPLIGILGKIVQRLK